jgi:hypothetical protein
VTGAPVSETGFVGSGDSGCGISGGDFTMHASISN